MNQPFNRSPKTSYYIRIAAGGYLLYTAYSLNRDWATVKPEHKLGIGVAIVLFAFIGFIICLLSSISLVKLNRKLEEQEDVIQDTEEQVDALDSEASDEPDLGASASEEEKAGTEASEED